MFENVVVPGDGYLRGAALTGNCPSADYRTYAYRFRRVKSPNRGSRCIPGVILRQA